MRKTLLLLEQIDSFEQFFAKSVSLPQVEVSTPYKKVHSQMAHKIRAISKRLPFASLHQFWIAEWQKRIDDFDTIVVFDNAASQKLLEFIKSRITKRTKLKIWLWNVPNERIEYLKENFDVYCFDQNYSKEYGLTFLEQFYILDSVNLDEKTDVLRDFYFVGTDKGRIQQLDQLAGMIEESELTYLFDVFSDDKQSNRSGINYLDSKITYPEIIKKIQESKVIVEINKDGQVGLTLRALESLFFKKKLITNNVHIKNYDFYHPNNIMIWEHGNLKELEKLTNFLGEPYHQLPTTVTDRYSFRAWIKRING